MSVPVQINQFGKNITKVRDKAGPPTTAKSFKESALLFDNARGYELFVCDNAVTVDIGIALEAPLQSKVVSTVRLDNGERQTANSKQQTAPRSFRQTANS